jgi:glycosyltransferase involved in cell wall biosynthesis
MKVMFFARGYGDMAGGIEKMSLDLARGLSKKGHIVTIISHDRKDAEAFFEWPNDVKWIKLDIGSVNSKNNFYSRIRRLIKIRNIVKKERYDVAVGFQVGSFALIKLATIFLKIRVVAAERNAPTLFNFIRNGKMKRFFSNIILFSADKIAIQFEEYYKYYPFFLRNKIVVTPNWVRLVENINFTEGKELTRVLYLGRLSYQKNVEILIKAMGFLQKNFSLRIVGDGPEVSKLINLTSQMELQNITFERATQNISTLFSQTDILCLPSRWEGFPNVIAEALAHGVPCVGYRDCSGMEQLIIDGINGKLAEEIGSPLSLANALMELSDMNLDKKIIINTVKKYSFKKFIDTWESALVLN